MSPLSEKHLGKVLSSSNEKKVGVDKHPDEPVVYELSSDTPSDETSWDADSEESSGSPSDNRCGAEDRRYCKVRRPSGAYRRTCHSCRVVKRRDLMLKCSQCVLAFCGQCLKSRHGEDLLEESQPGVQWVCPKCRPGCGPGCIKTCCFCSLCCRLKGVKPRGLSDAKKFYIKAKSVGSCGHDYFIHEDTGESLEAIAKRKLSKGWTKAGSNYSPSSDVTGARNDRHPSPHDDPKEKKGDENNRSPRARPICTMEKNGSQKSKTEDHHEIRPLDAVEKEFTHRSDAILQHDLRQTTPRDTKHSETDDEETDLGKCNLGDGADGLTANAEFDFDESAGKTLTANAEFDFDPANEYSTANAEFDFDAANEVLIANAELDFDPANEVNFSANALLDFDPANEEYFSANAEFDFDAANKTMSANAEFDFDAAHKALRDALEAVEDTAVNVELLTMWFSREKHSIGNRLSITLTDEEVQNRDEYKARLSSAIEILHQFDPEKMTLSECQDEISKQRLKGHAMNGLAKYRTVLQDLIKDRLSNAVPKAKRDSELAIQQIIAAVEKAVHAVPYNNH